MKATEKQIGIIFPVELLKEFQEKCDKIGITKSGIIKILVWDWLKKGKGNESES